MHYNVRDDGTTPSFTGLSEINCKDALEAALEYHRRGFRVTPLVGKDPILKGWPELELSEGELPGHFFEGRNVGIVLGFGGMVDIDLDNPLAVAAADRLLPETLKSGREKNPRSHWWYLCDPVPASRSYSLPGPMAERLGVDHGDAMLVELRSTGRQTAVAPSVHPEHGDRYLWHPGAICKIDGEELEHSVEDVAVATLLALHWPHGNRQRLVLCAAGYLGRHMEHGRVEAILEAAAVVAEDEEIDKRSRAVRDTLQKLEKEAG